MKPKAWLQTHYDTVLVYSRPYRHHKACKHTQKTHTFQQAAPSSQPLVLTICAHSDMCVPPTPWLYSEGHVRASTLGKHILTVITKVLPNSSLSHTAQNSDKPRTQSQAHKYNQSSVLSLSHTHTHTHIYWGSLAHDTAPPTISHVLTGTVFHRRPDKHPPPLPCTPRLTRCWYRQTFPKPPVPSRSRISQGPPAPGRSPGGRSMGREGERPEAPPLFRGRFRAAEARASFFSREASVISGNCGSEKARPEPRRRNGREEGGYFKSPLSKSSLGIVIAEKTHMCFPNLQKYKLSKQFP